MSRLPRKRSRLAAARVVLAAGLAVAARAFAECTSTEACLRAIEAAQQETRTIEADFVQVKHLSLLDEPLTSSGRFVFKRPDRIRLQIDQPQPTTIVINGKDVNIPSLVNLPASEKQAITMAPIAAMFTQLGAIFTGSTRALQEGFEVAARQADADMIEVKLRPRLAAWQRLFRSIEIRFGGVDLMAQWLRLEDGFGDQLDITLRNVQRNRDVPDALFDASGQSVGGSEQHR